MRIAIWHNLNSGGAKRFLYDIVRGLQAKGHYLEAWCPGTVDQSYLPLGDLITEHALPLDWQEMAFHERLLRKVLPGRAATGPLWAITRHCQECGPQISSGGFDVLLATSCVRLAVSPIGKYVQGIPKLDFLQEPRRRLYEAQPDMVWAAPPAPRGWLHYPGYIHGYVRDLMRVQGLRVQVREEAANARCFDQIIANSVFSRESIGRAYAVDASVCHPGIDTDFFHSTGARREPFVVGLGSIYFPKGQDRAIRALSTIEAARRPELVWIGNVANAAYLKEMQRLADSLDVCFTPRVSIADEELLDTLSRASALLYTSRLEPFGLAPLEANACGTPVIAIAEGGVRETITHGVNGILVPDSDPEALGRAIADLLANPKRIEELGSRARQHVVDNWSWHQCVDQLEHYLLKVIDKHA